MNKNDITKELNIYKDALVEQGKSENTIKNNISQVKKYLEANMNI